MSKDRFLDGKRVLFLEHEYYDYHIHISKAIEKAGAKVDTFSVWKYRNMKEKIVFTASLPPIQSAISIDGMGDGARIKLDIPASELIAVIKLQACLGRPLKITIEPEDDNATGY